MDSPRHDQQTRTLPAVAAEQPPAQEQPTMALPVHRPPLIVASEPPPRRWPKVALALLALLLAIGLVGGGLLLLQQDRVLPGVQVAGLELGGLAEAEAGELLANRLTAYGATPLLVEAAGQRWEITPRQLGVHYDVRATMNEVMRPGRAGGFAARLTGWLPSERRAIPVQPVGVVDQTQLLAGLQPALTTLNSPATDAAITIKPDAGLIVSPAAQGQQVDIAAAALTIQERALLLSSEPVALTLRPVPPAITEAELAPVRSAADELLRQRVTLELAPEDAAKLTNPATRSWTIEPRDLTRMLTLVGEDQRSLGLEESRLAAYLDGIANSLDRPSQPAELGLTKGAATLTPHEYGITLDVPATTQAVNAAIAAGRYTLPLRTKIETPTVLTADLEPVRVDLERLLERTLTLTAPELNKPLGRGELASFLVIEPRPAATPKAAIRADRQAINDYLTTLSKQINREARAPVFKYLGGQVTRQTEAIQGRSLRTEDAVADLAGALLSPAVTSLALPVSIVEPPLRNVNPSDIVIRDVLGSGSTYYGFSLPDRKHNVELATQRLNGTLVPPGEWFSFNRAVGRVNIASGYKSGYGIVLTNGAVQTVPSVGGGICQVATTVFHAAFHSGVPIGERNWHFYWIPTYGQAPSGITGLDATVDEDYGLDFTFRNTTGGWIALESGFDGQNMSIVLKGVNPGWQIQVDGPHLSNIKKADPTPVTREDATLPRGQRVQVETARDGMDVVLTRTVLKDGQVVDQRPFRSHYEPSQNVTLVGTGG